jgi:S1-C subfamily serine protease
MTRFFLAPCLVAIAAVALTGSLQAQQSRHHGPQVGQRLHYAPPSQFIHVQPPVFATPNLIDCSPELGFFGRMSRQGLLVTRVIPGTEAHFIGLVPGDTILRADRRRITCEHDWEQALRRAGRTLSLQVQRACGRTQTLQARLRGEVILP